LRPILVRYGARLQQQQLEKENERVSTEAVGSSSAQPKSQKDLQWGASQRNRQGKAVERQMHNGEDSDSDDFKELLE
jgi:hypothetical protein